MNIEEAREEAMKVALNTFLTEYPTNIDPQEILAALDFGNSVINDAYGNPCDIIVWQPFENDDPSDIALNIENLYLDILRSIIDPILGKEEE